MINAIKVLIFYLFSVLFVGRFLVFPVYAGINSTQTLQEAFDSDEYNKYIEFKNGQNNLHDNERDRQLRTNEYWLINKSQDLWIGVFDGKFVSVPTGAYVSVPKGGAFPEKVLRIKNGGKISQFLLKDSSGKYPPMCVNRRDGVLKDTLDYMVIYTGCAYESKPVANRLTVFYNIYFYSKEYDSVLLLDEFPDSSLQNKNINSLSKVIEKMNGYYVDYSIEAGFKFLGKDKVIPVDIDTGEIKSKVPDVDGNGNVIKVNGKPVMIDDPDGFQASFLSRVSEVTLTNQ